MTSITTRQLSIRYAKPSDISTIMELLQLKAEFDGCPDAIEATPEKLEDTLFSGNPLAFVLLADIEQKTIGFATYHTIYSTFLAKPGLWLDDLYVKAEYRGNRVGEALIRQLCQIAQEIGCGRIDWTVNSTNAGGINFYKRMGAEIMPKIRLCRLERDAIAKRVNLYSNPK